MGRATRWLIKQKARGHFRSHRLQAHGFRFYFTPFLRVLFTFPSRYYSLSVTKEYLGLESGLPRFTQNFACSALLRILLIILIFRLRGYHPLWLTFPKSFYYIAITVMQSYNPEVYILRFGLFPFRSPLLRESLSISFPLGTEMFHFPRLAPFRVMGHDSHWVSPFRHSRIKAHFQLPENFRR